MSARTRFFYAVLFIAVGVLLLLGQASLVDTTTVITTWWPTLIILAGVGQIVTRPHNLVGGSIVGVIGVALLLWTVGIVGSVTVLWPVLLIGIGTWLVLGRVSVTAPTTEDGEEVVTIFDDRHVVAAAGPLGTRVVTTIFGDLDLDLRNATIGERTTLHVVTIFGDARLEVPPGWDITVSGPEIFGDVSAPPPAATPPTGTLHLQVVTIFGDLRVRSTVLTV